MSEGPRVKRYGNIVALFFCQTAQPVEPLKNLHFRSFYYNKTRSP